MLNLPSGPGLRTRVAPSPTGDPHVGTAYVALFNIALARKRGGRFVLRIEDTDRSRYHEGSEEQLYEMLRWLGFDWDEGPDVGGEHGPYRQSERLDTYGVIAERLIAEGRAYRCWCTSERLSEMRREQQAAGVATGYDRLCVGKSERERAALPGFSERPVVRMLVPDDTRLTFHDLIHGELTPPAPDDQVIIKADGFPTYHLAVVADDHAMGVNCVIRGEEWISSTGKHLLLYEWLGWEPPQYGHMPLLRNPDKSKISKRKNPAARLGWFKEEGYLPHALVNFLALMGYSMPDGKEIFGFDEFVETFDIERVRPGGPIFDIDKLNWLNGHYVRELSDDDFLSAAAPFLPEGVGADDLRWLIVPLRERTKTLAELPEQLDWLAAESVTVRPEDMAKHGLPAEEATGILEAFAEGLATLEEFVPETIIASLDQVCVDRDVKRRRGLGTARLAVAGKPVSPPLDLTIAALGRDRAVERLRSCAAAFRA